MMPASFHRRGGGRAALLATAVFLMAMPLLAGSPFRGEPLYQAQCKGCHGDHGRKGIPGTPDFSWRGGANNGLMRPDPELLKRIKRGGQRCPAFMGILSDQEILDIISHVRTFN